MGFREVVRNSSLTLLAASLGAIGCQQSAPVRLSVASDEPGLALGDHSERTPVSSTDVPYVNPTWRDEDPPGLFMATVNLTGTALGTVFSPFIEVPAKGIQWLSGDRPSAADMLLEDRASADNRREGMNKLADFGLLGNPIFDKRCRQLAAHDVDFTVRATAIRTANRARDVSATPVFIKGLSDSDDWVRLESAKALANVPDVNAAQPLVELLSNREQSRDVRIAAADALKHYRSPAVIRSLSSVLSDKTFAVAWQARRSLRYLTGRDFGYDGGAWLTYFAGPDKPLG